MKPALLSLVFVIAAFSRSVTVPAAETPNSIAQSLNSVDKRITRNVDSPNGDKHLSGGVAPNRNALVGSPSKSLSADRRLPSESRGLSSLKRDGDSNLKGITESEWVRLFEGLSAPTMAPGGSLPVRSELHRSERKWFRVGAESNASRVGDVFTPRVSR